MSGQGQDVVWTWHISHPTQQLGGSVAALPVLILFDTLNLLTVLTGLTVVSVSTAAIAVITPCAGFLAEGSVFFPHLSKPVPWRPRRLGYPRQARRRGGWRRRETRDHR